MRGGGLMGGGVGLYSARTVQMTAMPQLVSMFNAVGGGAAALVAIHDYIHVAAAVSGVAESTTITTLLDVIIGSVTFSGSIIAAGKLQGVITSAPVTFRGSRAVNLLLAALGLGAAGYVISTPGLPALWIVIVVALAFGVSMVMPIGGGGMPGVGSPLHALPRTAGALAGRGLWRPRAIIPRGPGGGSGRRLAPPA